MSPAPTKPVIPGFSSDEEEAQWWKEQGDWLRYFDTESLVEERFPSLSPSTERVTIRMPAWLLERVKQLAKLQDMPYQSLMKRMVARQTAREHQELAQAGREQKPMWLEVIGETIELDTGTGYQPYTVEMVDGMRIGVSPQAKDLGPGEPPPSYRAVGGGEDVQLRYGRLERHARVLGIHQGLTLLGPARMQESMEEGDDCPYCWRPGVQGQPTGVGFGFGTGPTLPKAIQTERFECPDCGREWISLEWGSIVRRML